jgi:phosphatidylserine/phosphatidylglycerophosphate/cardiolipin synthase-like enzyme
VGSLGARLDAVVGDRIERVTCTHHRRRLSRVGQHDRLDPADHAELWAQGDPPVRAGCELEVLIDGSTALPRIADAIAGATEYVHIAGWHLSPDFGLTRDAHAQPLRSTLAELAERIDVRVLLWAGAPLPVFSPRRKIVREVRDELTKGTAISCALDAHERPMHCHHEKIVIVDGRIAFVGGIDLTSLGGDRFDSPEHPVKGGLGWHDVATRVEGSVVADVDQHFRARWSAVTGEDLGPIETPAPRTRGIDIQLVRTVPEKIYDFLPNGDFRILESYIRALRSAESLIYLENQFLWSPEITEILESKLRNPPSDEFRIVAVLPQRPNNGGDDTRGQVGRLIAADDRSAPRFLATTLRQRSGAVTDRLYVHAKVGIVDDAWLTIGSANLNEHSLFNDSEMNIVTCDSKTAKGKRLALWAEHLETTPADIDRSTSAIVDELWRPIATDQRHRLENGLPATHRLLELPGVSRRTAGLLGPVQSLLVDG